MSAPRFEEPCLLSISPPDLEQEAGEVGCAKQIWEN